MLFNSVQSNASYVTMFSVFAFDEEERILILSFLPKSLSRVLWTSASGIDRDAMRFQRLGAILDYVAHIASISCADVFLDAVSWNLHEQWNYRSRWEDRTHFTNLWLLLV